MTSNTAGQKCEEVPKSNPGFPLTVTAVKPQKKRTGHYSLFHNEVFIIGVSAHILARFNLGKGSEITADIYSEISQAEQSSACRNYMLQLLGRRDYSSFEIRMKAVKKGYSSELADTVIKEFRQKNYLNDEKFARKFANDKMRLNRWGPEKIKAKLSEKGLEYKLIEKVLDRLSNDLELSKICVDLVLKRRRHFIRESDDFKRKQKIAAYLQRKGFPFDSINRALPDIVNRLNV